LEACARQIPSHEKRKIKAQSFGSHAAAGFKGYYYNSSGDKSARYEYEADRVRHLLEELLVEVAY